MKCIHMYVISRSKAGLVRALIGLPTSGHKHIYIYIYMYAHIYTCTYIYIYNIHTQSCIQYDMYTHIYHLQQRSRARARTHRSACIRAGGRHRSPRQQLQLRCSRKPFLKTQDRAILQPIFCHCCRQGAPPTPPPSPLKETGRMGLVSSLSLSLSLSLNPNLSLSLSVTVLQCCSERTPPPASSS